MWTLIITVFLYGDAVTMTTVDNFGSRQTCMEAGRLSSNDILQVNGTNVRYQCVKK